MRTAQIDQGEAHSRQANIFSIYGHKYNENHFTNGLIALLRLSQYHDPTFIKTFLNKLTSLKPKGDINGFRVVLAGSDGTADAELCGKFCCVRFETKIVSGALLPDQVRRHLDRLLTGKEKLKKLVLLTPDDGSSRYIEQFLSIDNRRVIHLEWKSVYNYLDDFVRRRPKGVFSECARQFLELIRGRVFKQDIAGIIAKVVFGKRTEVYPDKYLDDMERGLWTRWNTPHEYKSLDGKGRKLLLYDRTRKAITVEVEIEKVIRTNAEPMFPWSNVFVPGKLKVYPRPIPLRKILAIPGFEGFEKGRSPYRKITQEQYRQL